MKNFEDQKKQTYCSPEVTMMEIIVEKGMALSSTATVNTTAMEEIGLPDQW